jgi:glycosyltransferase involved in cell wall biosynthesis
MDTRSDISEPLDSRNPRGLVTSAKMKLLRCIRSANPALGGVSEALRQGCLGLSELGHLVEVVCLDEPDAPWLRDYPVRVHALGSASFTLRRASLEPYQYSGPFMRWMRSNAGEYNAVTVEGLWQFPGLGVWLTLRDSKTPYFVIPHNQLDPWSSHGQPLKYAKKQAYWLIAQYRILRDAKAVLYLSEQEKMLARGCFWPYQAEEAVVGLAIAAPVGDPHSQLQAFFSRFPELRDKRLLLFMGRIHRVKGCDLLIEAFAHSSHADPSLHLVFVGPDQVGWQRKLQARVEELGLKSRVTWTGMLSGDAKWGSFHAAEAFVLPSHTEGFPVAMVEAMACGVPVLISDKVNIWREAKATGGAIVASDDLEGTTELLGKWLQLAPDERESMKRRARKGYVEQFSRSVALERLVSVLQAFGV